MGFKRRSKTNGTFFTDIPSKDYCAKCLRKLEHDEILCCDECSKCDFC